MTIRLGVIGLGVVGAETLQTLKNHSNVIEERSGQKVEIIEVSARDKSRDRGFDVHKYLWRDDPIELATSQNIDVVVELVGGEDGVALEVAEAALKAGKHLVTAIRR
jgi:homoserine dehydrogenase